MKNKLPYIPNKIKRTSDEAIAARRHRIERLRMANDVIAPFLKYLCEQGRRKAHNAITEMDITSRFPDLEDKIIVLFASLAARPGRETFATTNIFDTITPSQMVYERLFTEVRSVQPFSLTRFYRLMDTLWRWQRQYGSVYDSFEPLARDNDALSTLQWMFSDDVIPVEKPEYRLPRFLMALLLDDQGIGQALLPTRSPEYLTVPQCPELTRLKRAFTPMHSLTNGEVASLLHLGQETDLYYLALAWQDLLDQYPKQTASIVHRLTTLQRDGAQNRDQSSHLRAYLRQLLPDAPL